MQVLSRALLIAATMAILSAALFADTVRLKTGAILVGDVELSADGGILVTTRFPKEGSHVFAREDLDPRSLYEILDRRSDPKDVEARLELGILAESVGLWGLAASDYLAVAELRPEWKKDMAKRIAGVREGIAADLLSEAEELLEQGNNAGALMYLHTIQENYPKTDAAKKARKLMGTSHKRSGSAADVAVKTVPESKAPSLINSIKKDLDKAEKESRKLSGHEGASSRDRRAADRAIRYFEFAWKKIKTLPVAAENADLRAKIHELRVLGKEKLTQAYLIAGSIHLQQYSIPRAEEYCNKACALQPDKKNQHDLHRMIIEAKIYGGYSWIGR